MALHLNKKKTLAIFSPSQSAYSETFIQSHKKLPFNIKYYYGDYLPTALENGSIFTSSIFDKVIKKILVGFTPAEKNLLQSLRKEKVDCVLAEYGPTAARSLKVISYLKLPLVVHFHGYDASVYSVLEEYETIYKQVFDYASSVIVVSKKMKEALIHAGCPGEKLVLSVYGPHPSYFTLRPVYKGAQFISVGRFVEKKSPHKTIEAIKMVTQVYPAAKLVMVGEGEMLASCKNLVKQLSLENSVEFVGVKTATQIQSLFERSIAFVQHSVTASNGDMEGSPVAILEAQAAALPVISTYHAGIPDIVVHNETGFLVQEGDVEGMAQKMIQLLGEDGVAEKFGKAARERIANFYTEEKQLNTLTEEICSA